VKQGSHHTAETRAKMSIARMGNQNAANPTEETRANLRAARMGNQNALGHELGSEARAKISAANRGPDYHTHRCHYAGAYEGAWGQIPLEDSGRVYDIHHRDGDRQNDDPGNLIALTRSEHAILGRALEHGDWDLASEVDAVGESRRQPCALAARGSS